LQHGKTSLGTEWSRLSQTLQAAQCSTERINDYTQAIRHGQRSVQQRVHSNILQHRVQSLTTILGCNSCQMGTASSYWRLSRQWKDSKCQPKCSKHKTLHRPQLTYRMHKKDTLTGHGVTVNAA
jgi:hypothetical protein